MIDDIIYTSPTRRCRKFATLHRKGCWNVLRTCVSSPSIFSTLFCWRIAFSPTVSPFSTLSRKFFTLRRRLSLRSTTTPVAPLGLPNFYHIISHTKKKHNKIQQKIEIIYLQNKKGVDRIESFGDFHSSIEFGGVPCQLDQSVLYPTYKSVLGSPARRISGGSAVSGNFFLFSIYLLFSPVQWNDYI